MAFGYDDGSTFVVSGQLYGCRTLVVGRSYRADAEAPWTEFIRLLREQRDDLGEPETAVDPGRLDCRTATLDGPGFSPVADPTSLAAAVLCVTAMDGDQIQQASVPIPADDLAVLVEDIAENRAPMRYRRCTETPIVLIRGTTSWGDQAAYSRFCRMYDFGDGTGWEPGAEARAILDRLVSEARPVR
jgi:hypothetical protein